LEGKSPCLGPGLQRVKRLERPLPGCLGKLQLGKFFFVEKLATTIWQNEKVKSKVLPDDLLYRDPGWSSNVAIPPFEETRGIIDFKDVEPVLGVVTLDKDVPRFEGKGPQVKAIRVAPKATGDSDLLIPVDAFPWVGQYRASSMIQFGDGDMLTLAHFLITPKRRGFLLGKQQK